MILDIKNIHKVFGNRPILNNVSLQVEHGDTIAIIGPSGSGKTTLLNLIGALDTPDSGEIFFENQNLKDLMGNQIADFRNTKIGFVFQMHYLLPQCTLLENVLIPTLASKNKRQEKYKKAIGLLERVGLIEQINHFPGVLSGGECQRASFVRALINDPKLILADEPTGSLDQESAEKLGNLLLELNKELSTTLVVVTHSKELAEKMGRTYQLKNGELI